MLAKRMLESVIDNNREGDGVITEALLHPSTVNALVISSDVPTISLSLTRNFPC